MALELLSYGLLKDVVAAIWRGLRPTAAIPLSGVQGTLVETRPLRSAIQLIHVPFGWRGVILDAGSVQRELGPGVYRGRQIRALRRTHNLSNEALVWLWCTSEVAFDASFGELFRSDGHVFDVTARVRLAVDSEALVGGRFDPLSSGPAEIERAVAHALRAAIEETLVAEHVDPRVSRLSTRSVLDRLQASWTVEWLRPCGLESLTLRSESLVRQQLRRLSLEELQAQSRFDEAARLIAQDEQLTRMAARGELHAAAVREGLARVDLWKTRQFALLDAAEAVIGRKKEVAHSAESFARELEAQLCSERSPFTAHEREGIRRCLAEARGASGAEDVVSAVQRGLDIPADVISPFARWEGERTVRVGDTLRAFDGTSWQMQATRIWTRRTGFLWLRERVVGLTLEITGRPGGLRLEHRLDRGSSTVIAIGRWQVQVDWISETSSGISVRIAAARSDTSPRPHAELHAGAVY